MSLFSIVQGRAAPQIPPAPQGGVSTPPPMPAPVDPNQTPAAPLTHVMPDGSVMQGPPMYMDGGYAIMPGYMHGGMEHLGFEADYAPMYPEARGSYQYTAEDTSNGDADATRRYLEDGVMSIPGYIDPPPGTITFGKSPSVNGFFGDSLNASSTGGGGGGDSTPSAHAGDIMTVKANFFTTHGYNPSDAEAENILASMNAEQADQRAYAASIAGSNRGPDHFYEQLSYNTAKDAAERADQQRMADITQLTNQQAAIADWHKAQAVANQARQNNISSAAAAGQNAFNAALSQGDPNQAPLFVNYGANAEDAKAGSANGDYSIGDQNMPNIPGYVFTNPNGGQ